MKDEVIFKSCFTEFQNFCSAKRSKTLIKRFINIEGIIFSY